MPQERSRSIQYINQLRILSIYLVVTAHVTIGLTMDSTPFSFNWWLGTAIFYACFCSIPVFVMISGALLLDNSREEPLQEFYRKRMTRVGVPLAVWTVVYLCVRAFVDKEQLTAGGVLQLILTADPYYHLWFLYMIVGLYLVTPALRTFVRHATQKERVFVIVVMLILANAYGQADNLLWQNQRSIFTPVRPVHRILSARLRAEPDRSPQDAAGEVLSSWAFFCAWSTWPPSPRSSSPAKAASAPASDSSSISSPRRSSCLSIAIFWIARLRDALGHPVAGFRKTAVEWVASTTLGIYALHPLVLNWIQNALRNHAGDGSFLLGVLVVPLITFALCYLITSILMNIPLLRRTVC